MIASLPMYDWPEMHHIHDDFWRMLRNNLLARGIDAPQHLSRSNNEDSAWLLPELLFSQTCGYPFSTFLSGKVQYLTTPVFDVAGCDEGYYSSALVAHKDADIDTTNMKGKKFAYNSNFSWSGYRTVIREYGALEEFFGSLIESEGHRNSARLVTAGMADVAALDAVCWHLLQYYEPETASNLKVFSWTKMHPSLPFITSLNTSEPAAQNLVAAIKEVIASSDFANIQEHLPLVDCVKIDPEIYMDLSREN
jgi:ABC-type phosphate/phosphonate transport system substrate-binding protein